MNYLTIRKRTSDRVEGRHLREYGRPSRPTIRPALVAYVALVLTAEIIAGVIA